MATSKPTPQKAQKSLLNSAIRAGDNGKVKALLQGANIDQIDPSTGRTALQVAIANGRLHAVELLLARDADTEVVNRLGRSALHVAANSGNVEIVSRLIEYGAFIEAQDNLERTPLSLAAAYDDSDHVDVVRLLLDLGANPNSRDTNWQSPLALAARLGLENTVQILVERGAHIDSQDLDGQTPLFLAAANNHVDVVRLLLESGADSHMTSLEGKTIKDVAAKNDEIITLVETWQHNVRERSQEEKAQQKKQRAPHEVSNLEAKKLCKETIAHVTYYSKDVQQPTRDMSVHELIYEDKLKEDMSPESDTFVKFAESKVLDKRSANRWIHLPINNVTWIKDLIERLCYIDGNDERYCDSVKSFVEGNLHKHKGRIREASHRRPHFQWEPVPKATGSSDEKPEFNWISMVIPYFDIESKNLVTHSAYYGDRRRRLQKMYKDVNMTQSLDRSYHLGLSDTTERDRDQILSKSEPGSGDARLLMVPQLWLWRIDERTIISTCPDRVYQGEECIDTTLFKNLMKSFKAQMQMKKQISTEELVAIIVRGCLRFFSHPSNCGLSQPASDMFASYIAAQSDKEVKLRTAFRDSLTARHEKTALRKVVAYKKDIGDEVDCLQEVKDVRDEVNMILNVLGGQNEVYKAISAFLHTGMPQRKRKNRPQNHLQREPGPQRQLLLDDTIADLRERWERLDRDAGRVESSLNHLLDLKQKQASLDEAASASEEAKTAAMQNQAVLLFTVVTVIFTPLSFVTSLYALDTYKPGDEETRARSGRWGQGEVGQALGTAEGVTLGGLLFITFLLWAARKAYEAWKRIQLQREISDAETSKTTIQAKSGSKFSSYSTWYTRRNPPDYLEDAKTPVSYA